MQDAGIFRDRVIGFHLEAPPIRPHRRADAIVAQQVGNLVRFDRMVEGRDLVAKFLGHIEDDGHFISAIAVVLDGDVAIKDTGKRFHPDVAGIVLTRIPFLPIFLRLDPSLAVDGEVAHAGRRHPSARAINALRIFTACHFQAIRCAGEFHPLHGARIDILQHHRTAAHQVGRSRQDLQRGDATIGERAAETRILRPDAVFGPYFGRGWRGRLIAIIMCIDRRGRIIAKMRVDIDDARRHELAVTIEDSNIRRYRRIRSTYRLDLVACKKDNAIVNPSAFAIKNGDVADRGGDARIGLVGRRIRILVELCRLFCRCVRRSAFGRFGGVRTGNQGKRRGKDRPAKTSCHVQAAFSAWGSSSFSVSRCIQRLTMGASSRTTTATPIEIQPNSS